MKNTREIRWLQLPDLNKVPPDKLSKFSEILCEKFAETIDFVLITGDLYWDKYQFAKVLDFLNKLAEVIDKENIIIIAGDSDAVNSDPEVKKIIVQAREKINDNSFWQCTDSERTKLYSRFLKHANFLNTFYGKLIDFDSLYNCIHICEKSVALMCVNTAYISDDNHTKKQVIDLEEIKKQVIDLEKKNRQQKTRYPCIAVMHHDYYEINEAQRKDLRTKLDESGVSAILCGHKLKETLDFVELDDGTQIPICCCMESESPSSSLTINFGIFEYIWEINTQIVQLNAYEWHSAQSTFKMVDWGKFELRSIHSEYSLNEKKARKQINIPNIIREGNRRILKCLWECRKGLIVTMVSTVITLLLICAFGSRKAELHIRFKETEQDNIVVFTNSKKISEAWIQIVGQIVIITKDGEIIKTYLMDEMYEKSTYISGTKEFEIKRLECSLAASCIIKFKQELEMLLMQEGYDKDVITVKEIGFTAISLPTSTEDNWVPYYYILDGNSLIPLSSEQAEAKMGGTKITEEIWNNAREQKRLLAEFTTCVLRKLEEMSN